MKLKSFGIPSLNLTDRGGKLRPREVLFWLKVTGIVQPEWKRTSWQDLLPMELSSAQLEGRLWKKDLVGGSGARLWDLDPVKVEKLHTRSPFPQESC